MIEAILWDNDGVLVDTEHLYMRACAQLLEKVGIELTQPLFAEYSLTRGVSVFDLALEQGRASRDDLRDWFPERDDVYAQLLSAHDCVTDAARDVVPQLGQTLRMGIVTSAKRRHFELTHSRDGLMPHMGFAYTREDYELSKPHPDPYVTALQGQGLDPATTVVVEDTPRGVAAARAAGLRVFAMPNVLAPDADFSQATAVIGSLRELPDIVRQG